MRLLLALAAAWVAMTAPPRSHPPAAKVVYDPRNVAFGKPVYAAPGSFYTPGSRSSQVGLGRLTDGVFAGRGGLGSAQTILLAPYTADLPELPVADLPPAMQHGHGFVEVDLGGVYDVRTLVLEADASADYRVEGSAEGRFWTGLWIAPASFGDSGFVTRRSPDLPARSYARYVRVTGAAYYGTGPRPDRFAGDGRQRLYAVSELMVLSDQGRPRANTVMPGML